MDFNELYSYAENFSKTFNASKIPDQPAIYAAEITGEGGGSCYAEVKDNKITLYQGAAPESRCTIILSTKTVDDLACGRIKPELAFAAGKIRVRGDIGALMKIAAAYGKN